MTTWELMIGDQNRYSLVATLDERHVAASGDQYMPSVSLPLTWEEFLANGARQEASRRVLAVALNLHIPNMPHQHWVRTGLMPVTRAHSPILPLSHALIEELSRLAQIRPEGDVVLDISLQALAEPQDSKGAAYIHWHQNTQPVFIHAAKWHTMLKQWGYPVVRFVPLYLELPQGIGDGSKTARNAWSGACSHLKAAHEQWIAGHVLDAGKELRHAVQLAILTWGILWYSDNPPKETDEWGEIARRIGEGIPGCDVTKWTIKRNASADANRVFAILMVLRNLNAIANPFHHVGTAPVYTREDTDMLLTTTTAILRSLPEFLRQFPRPLQTGSTKSPPSAP